MTVLVLGATGGVGQQVVDQLLDAGQEVHALVRDPARVHREHERLHVSQGDGRDAQSVGAACAGQEAVVVTVGGGLSERTVRTEVTRHAVAGMVAHDVPRIVVVSSVGAGDSRSQLGLVGRAVVRTMLRNAIADHEGQEAEVRGSDRTWTILRAPGLADGPRQPFQAVPSPGPKVSGSRLSRASVAAAVVQALGGDWQDQAVALTAT